MLTLLLALLGELPFFIGFIKNGAYPPPLNRDDEEHYVNLFLNHKDQQARNKLIEHNLRLVVHIAKKYENNPTKLDDLISIGTIGLIKGIDSYDNTKGVKIATYCAKCIDNEILMHFRTEKKNYQDISLFDSIGTDKEGNDITLIDIIPSDQKSLPEQCIHEDLLVKLQQFLKVLNEREMEIITLRYGLNGVKELTQKEIARKFHISRSYVSRIEKRALIKLLSEYKKANDI